MATMLNLLVPILALAPHQEPGEATERNAYERLVKEFSSVAPAAGRLTAFFETRSLPVWRNAAGVAPKWQEIGPSVLKNGWGGMDNAGRTLALAVDPRDPRILWAGAASGGIWKSTDEGQTWRPMADDQASLSIGALAVDPFDPDTIYAGTGEPNNSLDSFHGAGFLRSRDGGKTWNLLATEVFLGGHFSRILAHPKRRNFLYAASTRGVMRSLDGGATWVRVLPGRATDLLIDPKDPNRILACCGDTGGSDRNGVFRSLDAGQTWTRLTQGLPGNPRRLGRMQMANCAAYPDVAYVAIYGRGPGLLGMYKTTDFGSNWIRLPNAPDYAGGQSWYDNYVGCSPTNPNVVFVGGTTTYRSLDGGITWEDNTRSYDGGPVHPDHHFLRFSPHASSTLYLCTDGGLFRSRNLGGDWESVNEGLATIQFQSVDVHPWNEDIAFGGTQDNGTNVYEGKLAWTNTFLGDGGVTRVNWKNPNVVYTEYVGLTICKSVDGGKSWRWNTTRGIDPREGKLFYAPYNLDPNDPDTLVAGAERVYRSTDAAENWSAISPRLGYRVSAVTVAPSTSKVIYAGTVDGRMWVTPNTGKEWYEITNGLPRSHVNDICVDPRNARVVYVALNGWSPDRIWKSTDAGGTWTNVTDNLPPMPANALALDPKRSDRLYLGTSIGVFVSDRGGGRWERMGTHLPTVPIFSLVANRRTGWLTAGTHGRGAWRVPIEK
jgi:photosystem II stability/assembly factor-like uncharacterized protein